MSQTLEDVLAAFERVRSRAAAMELTRDAYAVELIREGYFVGSSSEGSLTLLVATTPSRSQPAPTRLEYLIATYGVSCELHDDRGARAVQVSKLTCVDSSQSTTDLFGTVCLAIANRLGESPDEQRFAQEVARWTTLFWRLSQSVSTDLVGLVGELAVIATSRDPSEWIAAWHSSPNETLDFEFGEAHTSVEVKATRGSSREHVLSLDQVAAESVPPRYLASVLVALSDSGEPIGQLVRGISDRLAGDDVRLRLWDIVTSTCGAAMEEVFSRRVETTKTLNSVSYYHSWKIPRPIVQQPLPVGVRSIKFICDLTDQVAVGAEEIAEVTARAGS